jgi:restriction system protein
MSSRTETKSLHWDVVAALTVVMAAMYFLPFLRKLLIWPALVLVGVLAVLMSIGLFKRKPPAVTYNFSPPSPSPVATGATEMIRKSLADKIGNLDWLPFEQLVMGLYSTLGYVVKRDSGPHADGSINLALIKNKEKTLAQCKHWKVAEVDDKELKEFVGTLVREKMESGIFISPREFSFGARRFAAMNNLLLVGAKDLVRMLEGANWEKHSNIRHALEQSRKFCPCCQKDMVLKNAETGPNPGSRVWVCLGRPTCHYTVPA